MAELKFGAENSAAPDKHRAIVNGLEQNFSIIPIFSALDVYGREKARLNKAGTPLDDFDLLIGATAIANSLVLVTNNESHFGRMEGIRLENWVKRT